MASLTHVCMWSSNGWKRVTAEQAAELHPGGTVSANSGLFMCELCGQYVTLTDGDIRTRYFKHSAYEKSKECPERTFEVGYASSYASHEHDLPIRITDVSSCTFRFEIGLIRAPINLFNKDFCIEIRPQGAPDVSYVFAKERLNFTGITYLPIGERPFEKYYISFKNGNEKLRKFWPAEIQGVEPNGTLFEKTTGKKLPCDADVEIKEEYYLLKRGRLYRQPCSSVHIREVLQKHIGWDVWYLYVVSASILNEEAARFYLDFHCRLTDRPIHLQPIWPLFVEGNYLVKHNQGSMHILVNGDAVTVKTFPDATIHQLNSTVSQARLFELFCSDRQQLISAGRSHALNYTYVWKEPLDRNGSPPNVWVTDLTGAEVAPGETNNLPQNKVLRFKSSFDGDLMIYYKGCLADKQEIHPDKSIEIDKLSFGCSIKVIIGLDVIWQISFNKQPSIVTKNESEIMKWITHASGTMISPPHSLNNILVGLKNYPKVCLWIRQCIKCGAIYEQSYRRLQMIYRSIILNR